MTKQRTRIQTAIIMAIIALALTVPTGAAAQLNPILMGSYDTSGYPTSVFVSGDYAYVAGYRFGIEIIDISDPSSPNLIASYDTDGPLDVYVSGNYAYVADRAAGLKIIDVSDPSSPSLAGTYDTYDASGVYVSGNYAYIADNTAGILIIDVTNPSAPGLVGTYKPTGTASEVQVIGNYAYVAGGGSGLKIIDVTNPASPALAGSYNTPGYSSGLFVSGSYAYVADGFYGLQIIDVSNPASPTLAGYYDTPGESSSDVHVSGSFAYVADTGSGLLMIDVSDPANPTLVGLYNSLEPTEGIYYSDGFAYFIESAFSFEFFFSDLKIFLVDEADNDGDGLADAWENTYSCMMADTVDDEANPDGDLFTNMEEYQNIMNPCSVVACSDGVDNDGDGLTDLLDSGCNDNKDNDERGSLFFCDNGIDDDEDGFTDFPEDNDCSGPEDDSEFQAAFLVGSHYDSYWALGVYASGDYAYVAKGEGLAIFDVSYPDSPRQTAGFETYESAWDVFVSGDYAYALCNAFFTTPVIIIDISNKYSPNEIGFIYPPRAYDLHIENSRAYIAAGTDGLFVTEEQSYPHIAGQYDTTGTSYGVFASGGYAYVADGAGLAIIDVSDPETPSLAGYYVTAGTARKVAVSGGYAYVADSGSGLQIIDVSNPSNPTLAGSYNTSGSSYDVSVFSNCAFLADYNSGLQIIDVSSPTSPTLIACYDTPGTALSVHYSNGFVYVADKEYGLHIYNINSHLMDRDGDGMHDDWENSHSCMMGDTADATADYDADGLNNLEEYNVWTDPCDPDTDDDGYLDGFDLDPLDPDVNRYAAEVGLKEDQTRWVEVGEWLGVTFEVYDQKGLFFEGDDSSRFTLAVDGSAVFASSASVGSVISGGGTNQVVAEVSGGVVTIALTDAIAEWVTLTALDTEGLGASMPSAQITVDAISTNNSNSTGGLRFRGNVYHATATTTLTEHSLYLDNENANTMHFLVYESDAADGPWQAVSRVIQTFPGDTTHWFSSGDMHATLTAGKYYAIGAWWESVVNYYISPSSAAPSFGSVLNGCYLDIALPISDYPTLNTYVNFYYQTLKTDSGIMIDVIEALPDTDGDGLSDAVEASLGTDPDYWDSDGDGLPDGFEADNSVGHGDTGLDPLSAGDGLGADFDGDGIENAHEYYNGTDIWEVDVTGGASCFSWGDAGNTVSADGLVSPLDMTALKNRIIGNDASYLGVLPPNGDSQRLMGDPAGVSPLDLSLIQAMISGNDTASNPTIPTDLVVDGATSRSVEEGSTTRVTVSVINSSAIGYSSSFGVVFEIDPSSTGAATLLGGEGPSGSGRYDVSGAMDAGGLASIVVRVDSPGTIYLNATIPSCGDQSGKGRYCPEIEKAPAVTIVGY